MFLGICKYIWEVTDTIYQSINIRGRIHTKYGYGRVSSSVQNRTALIKQLDEAGCESIFKEKVTGRKIEGNSILIDTVQEGDCIVVTK